MQSSFTNHTMGYDHESEFKGITIPPLPATLYRLHHSGNITVFDETSGFLPSHRVFPVDDDTYLVGVKYLDRMLVDDFTNHCNKYHVETTLISTCDNPQTTLDRAKSERTNHNRHDLSIYEIKSRGLIGYRARCMAWRIYYATGEEPINKCNWGYLENEWVVYAKIPRSAIVRKWSVEEFKGEWFESITSNTISSTWLEQYHWPIHFRI